jgi:N-acetylglucosamine-6-phosphate deacetylase
MKLIKNVNLYGKLTDVAVENGKIAAIGELSGEGVDFGGAKIYPGLIDTHSHGCIGLDTMEGGLSEMADWELEHGITTWYPTTMTMSEKDIIEATHRDIDFGHGANIPGFHMEGPFINKKFKGAQNEAYILPPSMELFNKCKNIKTVTIAPETEGSDEFIKNCPAVVSLGHTDASYDVAKKAFDRGAKKLTHTFNVMPPIHHRAPGPIGAGSDSEGVYAELICDGKHVHPSAVKMLIKIFGEDRIILVSDSMRATGLGDGIYSFGGQKVIVKDGTALTESGNLAGSTSNLFDCVKTAISFGIKEEVAVKMASENPAKLMGLNKGRIEVGYDADFIIVDDTFNLIKAIARGEF